MLSKMYKVFSLLIVLGMLLAACGPAATEQPVVATEAPVVAVEETEAPAEPVSQYSEAPMLAEMVAAGDLPPVEERLPENPAVITPYESIGQYGQTWSTVWKGASDRNNANNHINFVRLFRMDETTGFDVQPDLAEKVDVSADGTEYTFYLRKGLKWSDGMPYTTEDIMFFWEDVMLNEEINPGGPDGNLTSGGEPAVFEAIDETTFKITFKEPYGAFLALLGSDAGKHWFKYPKHYMSQFHASYADKATLDQLVSEAGLENWTQLFDQKQGFGGFLTNVDLPVREAWMLESPVDESGRIVFVRNPYFHQVDTEGNQLPYIDRVEFIQLDKEVALLSAANGEIDLQIRYFNAGDFPVLKENEAAGGYTIVPYYEYRGATAAFYFNQTLAGDDVLKEIFQDVRFRQATSLAINRAELNTIEYLGLAEPRQASWPTLSPFYNEAWTKAFAEYDVDAANQLLDDMGLTERDADGFRLRPDGKTLEVICSFGNEEVSVFFELVEEYLEAIGISITLNPLTREVFEQRVEANDVEMSFWGFEGAFFKLNLDVVPNGPSAGWGPLWAQWLQTDGQEGEEPPADVLRLAELKSLAVTTPDLALRAQYMDEIADILRENLWIIGIVGGSPRAGVVSNKMHNVPVKMPYGGLYPIPAIRASQFWLEP